jgi:hypothetical protein
MPLPLSFKEEVMDFAQVRTPESDSKKQGQARKRQEVATCLTYIGSASQFVLPVPLVIGQAPNSWH